jgi:protein-tyrosine sulfotransferase
MGDPSQAVSVRGPVIVVGSAQSGVALLRQALAAGGSVTWVDAPGLVHLGHQVARTSAMVQGRADGTSALARKAVSSLIQVLITARLAADGRPTWSATTVPEPQDGLEFFADMVPTARFVCLHRRWDTVVRSLLTARPWGIDPGTGFDRFTIRHPLSPAAAVAEYWAAHTAALAGFETAHPDRCLRVRYEDMLADPAGVSSLLQDFTGAQVDIVADEAGALSARGTAVMPAAPEQVPVELMARVNDLMTGLGYPALEFAPTARRP